MSFTGDVHTQIGGWHISARRGFFDEAGDGYAFCAEQDGGRKEWLESINTPAGPRIPHLDDTDLPVDVKNAAIALLASLADDAPATPGRRRRIATVTT